MKRLVFLTVTVFLMMGWPLGHGQQIERIAAVVNEDVISQSDVIARLRLALLSSGLQPTQENQRRLLPQVLRGLIDESLQQQEAERLGIEVPQADVDRAIEGLAAQNNLTREQFLNALAENQVPLSTIEAQVRTSLAWNRLVERQVLPDVDIGDEEIDEVMARLSANRGLPEYRVSEIFLAVDEARREAEVRQFAEQLVEEIRQGAPFPAVARQFSQSAGAAAGGDLGWIVQGQLAPELDEALSTLAPGQVSDPLRTLAGYHILLLRDQRRAAMPDPDDAVVSLYRVALPLPQEPTRQQLERAVAAAQDVHRNVEGCEAMAQRAERLGVDRTLDVGTGRIGDLPGALAEMVRDLPVGEPTEPALLADAVAVFMVCERRAPEAAALDRSDIANALGQERMDMLARRYLRDLRNAAFIDMRV